jgi:hypothetical protein
MASTTKDLNSSSYGLTRPGTIAHWHVGDIVDFQNTEVTSVQQTGDRLTVTFDGNQEATYKLRDQEHNTQFQLQPDGHGGTDLILVHIVGVAHAQRSGHVVLPER